MPRQDRLALSFSHPTYLFVYLDFLDHSLTLFHIYDSPSTCNATQIDEDATFWGRELGSSSKSGSKSSGSGHGSGSGKGSKSSKGSGSGKGKVRIYMYIPFSLLFCNSRHLVL